MDSDDEMYILSQAINGLLERISRDLEKNGLRPSAINGFEAFLIHTWKKEFNLTINEHLGVDLWYQNNMMVPREKVSDLMKLIEDRSYEAMERRISWKGVIRQPSQEATREYLLDRCKKECEKRNLPKLQTINKEMKYDIAEAIGMKVPIPNKFKTGEPSYQLISKMLSELKYSRKRPSRI